MRREILKGKVEEVLRSLDANPVGHRVFAEIVASAHQRCRFCGCDHNMAGAPLCMRAADDARRARAWARRELR